MTTGLVGSIVGPLFSSSSVAAATLGDTGHGYDVAVGGLGFKLKISEGTPYERATAQFRKEQFDNSGTYGDQSLTGMWTRGQFSFHKGAGLRYYEVSDGETVLNRYSDSQGVDPFTTLGQVTLRPAWTSTTSTSLLDSKWIGGGGNWVGVIDGATFKYTQSLSGGAMTSYGAASATAVAASNLSAYVATSTSEVHRITIAGGATTTLYTGALFASLFYAKDRLWGWQNSDKSWYQLSPNPTAPPVAVVAGDKVFTMRDPDPTWAFADTPGPVLFGNGTRIFSVTVGSDGAVPTMSGPVQVAELPVGETIKSLRYHLGFLVIATSRGLRVAVVDESGRVTFGPLLVTLDSGGFFGTEMGVKDSSVFAACRDADGTSVIWEVNLAQQIGTGLEFAVAKAADRYSYVSAQHGVGNFGTTLVSYGHDGGSTVGELMHEGANLAASGELTTAYHRFGTLEPKKFQTVKVRGSGTGSIDIFRVMADGSAISLYTMDLDQNDTADITLGLSDPIEVVGLKFALNRDPLDSTKGPTLLGYQLRALPAPKRQRMIRLPVLLHDVEKRGSTRALGYEGSAWERLSALEEMEQSGGTFQFQDFRTGEAGEVYIESIEHKGITPPGHRDNGYGGVVWLTLKKL